MAKNAVLSDKKALIRTLERLKKKQELCNKYIVAHQAHTDQSKAMHDTRNIISLALMQIDTEGVPESEWDQLYDREIGKMVEAFTTPDPATNMPYSDRVKPYIKRLYDDLTTSNTVTDWSDERQIESFLCSLVVNQAQSTIARDFAKECIELYPTARERELLDAKCAQSNIDLYLADRRIREYGMSFDEYIPVNSVPGNSFRARTEEFINGSLNAGVINDSGAVTLDHTSFDLMNKFLKGKEFNLKDDIGNDQYYPDYTHESFARDLADVLIGDLSTSMPFERMIVGSLENRSKGAFDSGDVFLINGKPISEIKSDGSKEFSSRGAFEADVIRNALMDGESVVEVMRVGFENDGSARFRHQEIKVDLDKLNGEARKEEHNIFRRMLHSIGIWKIPNKYPTNAERDRAQEQRRADGDFRTSRAMSEKKLVDKYNALEPQQNAKANSFSKSFGKLKHVTDVELHAEGPQEIPRAEDLAQQRESISIIEVAEEQIAAERSRAVEPEEPTKIKELNPSKNH